jgi:cholest-4-en-3-one 26-monooxygenase
MSIDAATVDLSSVDLTDLDLFADGQPHALFARMRAEAPVRWNPSAHGPGFWSLTRATDITAVSEDPATFSSARGGIFMRPDALAPLEFTRNFMTFKDPPEHTKYRSIGAKAFLPRTLGLIDEAIHVSVTQALNKVEASGECDLVRDVAVPIPVGVIMRLFGDPEEDTRQLLAWTDEFASAVTQSFDIMPTFKQMYEFFLNFVNNQLLKGMDSLAHAVANAEVDGQRLTEEEIAVYFGMLLYGGNGPTRNAISSGMLALLEHPDQRELLRQEPSRLRCTQSGIAPPAVEEILRWSTPVGYFARTATRNTSIRGVNIKADDRLVMWYTSASRDSEVFPNADQFDITRPKRDLAHYAFGGGGPHFCQAAPLARKMLSVSLKEIIRRLPDIKLAGRPMWVRSNWVNSLASLPVTFTPTGSEQRLADFERLRELDKERERLRKELGW